MASGLAYTIVRPGALTDDPGTGRIRVGDDLPRDEVTRDDVAEVLDVLLETPSASGAVSKLRTAAGRSAMPRRLP